MEDGVAQSAWAQLQPRLASPVFDAVRGARDALDPMDWPTLAALNAASAARALRNTNGQPIRFVAPTRASSAMDYEMQIATTGEIPTRENLHDLFNALQWLSLPNSKSTINREHVQRLAHGGDQESKSRSRERDVLTMFDESGVIVASSDATLLELLRNFQWRTLFVDHRDEVIANMRFYLVGHGLMEKALAPFIGITGKSILLSVTNEQLDDMRLLDRATAEWLSIPAHLSSAQHLAPLPLLGVPGWDARNEAASFYDNTDYFRSARTRQKQTV